MVHSLGIRIIIILIIYLVNLHGGNRPSQHHIILSQHGLRLRSFYLQ